MKNASLGGTLQAVGTVVLFTDRQTSKSLLQLLIIIPGTSWEPSYPLNIITLLNNYTEWLFERNTRILVDARRSSYLNPYFLYPEARAYQLAMGLINRWRVLEDLIKGAKETLRGPKSILERTLEKGLVFVERMFPELCVRVFANVDIRDDRRF